MKKILIGIVAVSLIMLYSCSDGPEEGPGSQEQNENITTASYSLSDEAVSDSQSEITSASTAEDDFKKPDQSFIGVWSTDELKTDQILIYEITEVTVKFNAGISGLFGFDATAMLSTDGFIFGDGISPGYSGPVGVKGKLEFSDNSVTVIYDSLGSLPDAEYYPNKYTFTIKDDNSDAIVSQHNANP